MTHDCCPMAQATAFPRISQYRYTRCLQAHVNVHSYFTSSVSLHGKVVCPFIYLVNSSSHSKPALPPLLVFFQPFSLAGQFPTPTPHFMVLKGKIINPFKLWEKEWNFLTIVQVITIYMIHNVYLCIIYLQDLST